MSDGTTQKEDQIPNVFEIVSAGGGGTLENDPDVLRAVNDLLSTPLSEEYSEDALKAILNVQKQCEKDYVQICQSSASNSAGNMFDFNMLTEMLTPQEYELLHRRLSGKTGTRTRSRLLKTQSKDILSKIKRVLQAPLLPHRGAHVGPPSITTFTSTSTSEAEKIDATEFKATQKERAEELKRQFSLRSEYGGNPNLTKLLDRIKLRPRHMKAKPSGNQRKLQGRQDEDGSIFDLFNLLFPEDLGDDDDDDDDGDRNDDGGDGTDDVPFLFLGPGDGPHAPPPLGADPSNGSPRPSHVPHHGPPPLQSITSLQDPDYQVQLGYGPIGDMCLMSNLNRVSPTCMQTVADVQGLREEYNEEVMQDSIYQHGSHGKEGHPFLFFWILFIFGIVFFKRHMKMKKIRNILNVIEASPSLKAQVEEAAGTPIPPHREDCKDCGTFLRSTLRTVIKAFLMTVVFFFVLITSVLITQSILGIHDDDNDGHSVNDNANGEDEDGPDGLLVLFVLLSVATVESVIAVKLYRKALKCFGRQAGEDATDTDDANTGGNLSPNSSSRLASGAYARLPSTSSHGSSRGPQGGAQHTEMATISPAHTTQPVGNAGTQYPVTQYPGQDQHQKVATKVVYANAVTTVPTQMPVQTRVNPQTGQVLPVSTVTML